MNVISTIVPLASLMLVRRSRSCVASNSYNPFRGWGKRLEPFVSALEPYGLGRLQIDDYGTVVQSRFCLYALLSVAMRSVATVHPTSPKTRSVGNSDRLFIRHIVVKMIDNRYLHYWFLYETRAQSTRGKPKWELFPYSFSLKRTRRSDTSAGL